MCPHLAPDALATQPGAADLGSRDTELVEALAAASAEHEAVLGSEASTGAHKAEVRGPCEAGGDEAGAGQPEVIPVSGLPELHSHLANEK